MKPQVGVTILALLGALAGCGGGSEVDLPQAERDIQRDYQKQLDQQLAKNDEGVTARVDSVQCVKKSDEEGRCFATISGDIEGRQPITITFGENGEYLWEADTSGGLNFNVAPEETAPEDETPTGDAMDDAARAQEVLTDLMRNEFPDVGFKRALADPGVTDTNAIIQVSAKTSNAKGQEICDAALDALRAEGLSPEQLTVIPDKETQTGTIAECL